VACYVPGLARDVVVTLRVAELSDEAIRGPGRVEVWMRKIFEAPKWSPM
jgi:hypothetical protein